MKRWWTRLKERLSRLSFATGVRVALLCVLCYALSFAALALPVSPWWRCALWATLFGMAKTAQYTAILILGTAGVQRLKAVFRRS